MLSAALVLLCVDVQQEQPHINAYASSLIFLTKADINLIHQKTLLIYEGNIHSSSCIRGDEIGHNVSWQLLLCDYVLFTGWQLFIITVIAGLIDDKTYALLKGSTLSVQAYQLIW